MRVYIIRVFWDIIIFQSVIRSLRRVDLITIRLLALHTYKGIVAIRVALSKHKRSSIAEPRTKLFVCHLNFIRVWFQIRLKIVQNGGQDSVSLIAYQILQDPIRLDTRNWYENPTRVVRITAVYIQGRTSLAIYFYSSYKGRLIPGKSIEINLFGGGQ